MLDSMQPISEDGQPQQPEYEWDGLRRRRTTLGSRRPTTASTSHASTSTPQPPRSPHPPLGMSRFPDDYDEHENHDHDDRSTIFSSIAGSLVRGRGRSRTTNTLPTYDEEEGYGEDKNHNRSVILSEVPGSRRGGHEKNEAARYGDVDEREHAFYQQDTSYPGAVLADRIHHNGSSRSLQPPTPPPHSTHRQFSFNRVFRRTQLPSEEERAGLVLGGEGSDRRGSDGKEGERDSSREGDREGDREAFI